MKKHFALALVISSLLTISCAQKKDESSRSIVRRAGTGSPVADAQAQAVGLNISWQKSELNSDDEASSATHTFTVNSQTLSVATGISPHAPDCSIRQNLDYDAIVTNTAPADGIYSAVGYTTCQSGTTLFLGLNFMAWKASGNLVQEFVLLNLNTKNEAVMIQKQVTSQSSATFLPDWISYNFSN